MKRREFLELSAALPLASLVGCGGEESNSAGTPGPADASTVSLTTGLELPNLPRLGNLSGVPGVFQANLLIRNFNVELAPGRATEVWGYNQTYPGPLIEVTEGDTIRIFFINNIEQDSSIHWHGLPVPPEHDGNPMDPVPPQTQRLYEYTLPPGSAGTYWYHPHPAMVAHEQVYRGMAGMYIVRAPSDPVPAGIEEKHLFITDVRLDTQAVIPANTVQDRTNGREGNHLLVNGRENPRITIRPGQSQRWRIVNATNARFLRLSLTGHTLTLIATDGGLLASAVARDEILLGPAERIEVIVTANQAPGTTATLFALPYDRRKLGPDRGPSPQVPVVTLAYTRDAPVSSPPLPPVLRPIQELGPPRDLKQVEFLEEVTADGTVQFLVNGQLFDMERVDLVSELDAIEEWEIVNRGTMDHPFHLHGGQFQVLSRTLDGVATPEPFLAWRDTVNLRFRESIRMRTVQNYAGKRMFHCHILEHEDHGMMGVLEVV